MCFILRFKFKKSGMKVNICIVTYFSRTCACAPAHLWPASHGRGAPPADEVFSAAAPKNKHTSRKENDSDLIFCFSSVTII